MSALKWRLDPPKLVDHLTASADEARDVIRRLGTPDESAERYCRALTEGSDEEVEAAFNAVLPDVLDRLETGALQSAHTS